MTFIGYYLPDDDTSGAYWATTHFTPDLQVEILNLTRIADPGPPQQVGDDSLREVIGSWLETGGFRTTLVIFTTDARYFIETLYNDGSSSLAEVKESKTPLGQRFEKIPGNDSGDHWLLRPSGELELRNAERLIYKCIRLNK